MKERHNDLDGQEKGEEGGKGSRKGNIVIWRESRAKRPRKKGKRREGKRKRT